MSDNPDILTPGPVAAIGLAIIARLKLAFPESKFEHAVLPAKLDAALWSKLMRRTPWVGFGWTRLEPKHEGGSQFIGRAIWTLFLVTQNQRGTFERFFGDSLAPGLLQMTQVAVAYLQGHNVPGIGSLTVSDVQNGYAEDWKDESLALTVLEIGCGLSFTLSDVVSEIDGADMTGAITWSFNGGANAAPTETETGTA